MSSAVAAHDDYDVTPVPFLVRHAIIMGIIEAVVVVLMSFITRYLDGAAETVLGGIVLAIGLAILTLAPGLWTRARTVEGIAGAAAIGLGATVVFLLLDVALLQPLGMYSDRWLAIGGGSNWWYHPVWWMVGTFIPWQGSFILANQTVRRGAVSIVGAIISLVVFTAICGIVGILIHVPHAGWTLGTFGVAFLPGLVLAALLSMIANRRV